MRILSRFTSPSRYNILAGPVFSRNRRVVDMSLNQVPFLTNQIACAPFRVSAARRRRPDGQYLNGQQAPIDQTVLSPQLIVVAPFPMQPRMSWSSSRLNRYNHWDRQKIRSLNGDQECQQRAAPVDPNAWPVPRPFEDHHKRNSAERTVCANTPQYINQWAMMNFSTE